MMQHVVINTWEAGLPSNLYVYTVAFLIIVTHLVHGNAALLGENMWILGHHNNPRYSIVFHSPAVTQYKQFNSALHAGFLFHFPGLTHYKQFTSALNADFVFHFPDVTHYKQFTSLLNAHFVFHFPALTHYK